MGNECLARRRELTLPRAAVLKGGNGASSTIEKSSGQAAAQGLAVGDRLAKVEAEMLAMAMDLLDDGTMLRADESNTGRDDIVRWVDESSAMLPIEAAMQRLKGFGAALQEPYAQACTMDGT